MKDRIPASGVGRRSAPHEARSRRMPEGGAADPREGAMAGRGAVGPAARHPASC